MMCCQHCGARVWKGEDEANTWRAIALSVLHRFVGRDGVHLIGPASVAHIERVDVSVTQDSDSIRIEWRSPSLVYGEGRRAP